MASYCPEIPRARFRVLFFAAMTAVCATAGLRLSLVVAACCFAIGLVSALVAHSRGRTLALTFIAIDWLGMGLMWAASGGSRSQLLFALPALLAVHLIPTSPREWSQVTAPLLGGVAVLLIADPTLGGNRLLGIFELIGLTALGFAPALLLSRQRAMQRHAQARHVQRSARRARAAHSQAARTAPATATAVRPAAIMRATVDPTTGFHGLPRAADLLTGMMRHASESHEAIGVLCIRLDRWADIRGFHGELAAEAAAAQAAKRMRRHLRPGDLTFRVRSDTFLLALRDKTLSQATAVAAELGAELAGQRLERSGERLTASCGVSSFPATRSLEALLREAAAGAEASIQADAASDR